MGFPRARHREDRNTIWRRYAAESVAEAGILDEEVAEGLMRSFARIPRDLFVSERDRARATQDVPIALGAGRFLIKPSLLARLWGLLGIKKDTKVLEIGAGSGYVSALLTDVGAHVFSVESIGPLAQRTRKLLDYLKFQNVILHRGKLDKGLKEHAPYSAILCIEPFTKAPPELCNQLDEKGGKLAFIRSNGAEGVVTLVEKQGDKISTFELESVLIPSDWE